MQIYLLSYRKRSRLLDTYWRLLCPDEQMGLRIYMDRQDLEQYVPEIERAIEAVANENLEGLPQATVKLVAQLGEMRQLRKSSAIVSRH